MILRNVFQQQFIYNLKLKKGKSNNYDTNELENIVIDNNKIMNKKIDELI